jgi:hypothetical protein
LPSLPK